MRLYTLSGIYRERVLAVERKKEKKEKGKKEKREKQRGFPKDRFVHFCTIPLHFSWSKA